MVIFSTIFNQIYNIKLVLPGFQIEAWSHTKHSPVENDLLLIFIYWGMLQETYMFVRP